MQKVTTQEMIVLLNEIGEQAVAAMAERGDGEEHDPIMDMLARKVQIINAIAERVRDMTAVEYARAHDEICDAHQNCMCESCPLGDNCVTLYSYDNDIRRAIEIVRK